MPSDHTALTAAAGLLLAFGVLGIVLGEFLAAGLCFLLLTTTLYLRETRS